MRITKAEVKDLPPRSQYASLWKKVRSLGDGDSLRVEFDSRGEAHKVNVLARDKRFNSAIRGGVVVWIWKK